MKYRLSRTRLIPFHGFKRVVCQLPLAEYQELDEDGYETRRREICSFKEAIQVEVQSSKSRKTIAGAGTYLAPIRLQDDGYWQGFDFEEVD